MDTSTGSSTVEFVVPWNFDPGTYDLNVINEIGVDTKRFTIE
jgi:hypothetical protein